MKAVLCDIEGTTTSLSFAHDVLFPISRREMRNFVYDHWNDTEMRPLFDRLEKQSADEVIEQLHRWIDQDKKEQVLKQIQGRIWKKSYEEGQIQTHIYADVPRKWSEWKAAGVKIYIFSSGSVEAQQLLFRYTEHGDLAHFIDGYFDTTTGPKKEAESYRRIANAIGLAPEDVLFLSDVVEELDAARAADMQTVLVVRESQRNEGGSGHTVVSGLMDVRRDHGDSTRAEARDL